MIKVKTTFTINSMRIKELTDAAKIANVQTAEALHTEVLQAQVIPRDTGNLQGEAFWIDRKDAAFGRVRLVHSAPYARRVYFNPDGMKFHRTAWKTGNKTHDGNPNARDHWFADWLPGGSKQDFVSESFKRLYRRNARLGR